MRVHYTIICTLILNLSCNNKETPQTPEPPIQDIPIAEAPAPQDSIPELTDEISLAHTKCSGNKLESLENQNVALSYTGKVYIYTFDHTYQCDENVEKDCQYRRITPYIHTLIYNTSFGKKFNVYSLLSNDVSLEVSPSDGLNSAQLDLAFDTVEKNTNELHSKVFPLEKVSSHTTLSHEEITFTDLKGGVENRLTAHLYLGNIVYSDQTPPGIYLVPGRHVLQNMARIESLSGNLYSDGCFYFSTKIRGKGFNYIVVTTNALEL